MFLTTVQWISPGLDWYLLMMLKAYKTFDQLHIMVYMIDPIVEAYGIVLMHPLLHDVVGHYPLDKYTSYDIGKKPFLESYILKHLRTCSLYVLRLRPSSLCDLSHRSWFLVCRMVHLSLSSRNNSLTMSKHVAVSRCHFQWVVRHPYTKPEKMIALSLTFL